MPLLEIKPSLAIMRVKGMIQDKTMHILIDSVSTHNFLDLRAAMNMNCVVEPIIAQTITVADENQITCHDMVGGFVLKFNGQ